MSKSVDTRPEQNRQNRQLHGHRREGRYEVMVPPAIQTAGCALRPTSPLLLSPRPLTPAE